MKGTTCDACMTGYKPGQLIVCDICQGEFCSTCSGNHGCRKEDLG